MLHLEITGWLKIDIEPTEDLSKEEIIDLLQDEVVCLNLNDGSNSHIECAERGVLANVIYLGDHINVTSVSTGEDEEDDEDDE
jgi:hypothetical protein